MLPVHMRGALQVMRPQYSCLSPIVGLLASQASCSQNLAAHPHTLPESLLASELFLAAGGKLQATTSRSKPGAHLDIAAWGSVIGLALSRAGPDRVREVLTGEHGVLTRRGNQRNPPRQASRGKCGTCLRARAEFVYLERYCRLVDLVRDVIHRRQILGHGLLGQFAFEKSASKEDMLRFLLAVDAAAPEPVLQEEFRSSAGLQQEWVRTEFSQEISCDSALEDAAVSLLTGGDDVHSWASNYELVAAGLCAMKSFRPPLKLHKFSYCGGRVVPDCVEVVVREIVELMLYQPHQRRFELSMLPSSTDPRLIEFLKAANAKIEQGICPSTADDAQERDSAGAWFNLCQDLPRCDSLEYTSRAPNGECYELTPTMPTVSRTLQYLLLGVQSTEHTAWRSLSDVAAFWNERHPESPMHIVEERKVHRSTLMDGSRITQNASVWVRSSGLHVELNPAHNGATCKHHRQTPRWASPAGAAHSAHLQASLSMAQPGSSVRHDALRLLWPSLLGSSRLSALAADREGLEPTPTQVTEAVLSASYERSDRVGVTQRLSDSGYLVANLTTSEVASANKRVGRRVIDAIDVVASMLARLDTNDGHDNAGNALKSLPWLVAVAPDEVSPRDMACALSRVPITSLQGEEGILNELARAMETRGQEECLLLQRMIGYSLHAKPLTESLRGLSILQGIRLLRFVWATNSQLSSR